MEVEDVFLAPFPVEKHMGMGVCVDGVPRFVHVWTEEVEMFYFPLCLVPCTHTLIPHPYADVLFICAPERSRNLRLACAVPCLHLVGSPSKMGFFVSYLDVMG